jgi:HPt (histidine-containing phosphotransfer) domain-containing protein
VTAIDLDVAHLNRQTMGDADLRRDVLGLARDQFAELAGEITRSPAAARADLAHRLKGAARAVGAFALADAAVAVEAAPDSEKAVLELARAHERLGPLLRSLLGGDG